MRHHSRWDAPRRNVRARWLLATTAILALVAPAAAGASLTTVSLTFDDANADQAQAGTILAARGLRGTFYVNSGRLGVSGFMTLADVQSLKDAGHEIAGHTVSHADLPALDEDERRRQICNDRVALLGEGFTVTSFAYPYADTDALTQQIVAACGYNSARGVGDVVSPGSCYGCPFAETIPPSNPFKTKTPDSIKSWNTLEDIEAYVTQAEANGGGWVQLVFHHVCDGCNSYAVSPSTLGAFADWLAARASLGTIVRTVGDVVGGPVQPGVAGPPPAPRPPGGNMLMNPSLESDSNPADGLPDCWQLSSFGTSSGSGTRTSDAQDGAWAYRVDITSYSTGSRRLVSRQDLGSCAPPIVIGHSYTVSNWYKSSAQAIWIAYHRNTSGGWVWWAQSPWQPPSTDWKQSSWTTPPAPAGATAISVGLALYSVGSLTVDAFSLKDADATPPTVTVTSPADGASVSGVVQLSANASDAGGIDHVEFLLNGVSVGAVSSPPPYVIPWDTTTISDSKAVLAARAYDLAGNVAISTSMEVTIANAPPPDDVPPTVVLVSPAQGSGLHGAVTLEASASDNVALKHVDFLVNGNLVATAMQQPYRITWESTNASPGPGQVSARAFDTSGNSSSATAGVFIDQVPPTVVLVAPSDASTVSGVIDLRADAQDDLGVDRVDFTVNGVVIATVSGSPANAQYDTTYEVNGPAVVTATAYDHGGNASAVAVATVTISNLAPDLLSPVTSIQCNGTSCADAWYLAPVTVTLSAVDGGGSGLSGIVFTTDGSDPVPGGVASSYAGPFTVAAPVLVRYRAFDNAGNVEAIHDQWVRVDSAPPSTSMACNCGPCLAGAWFNAPVTVTLAAADATSGVSVTRYTTDGSAPDVASPAYGAPLVLAQSAIVSYRSWDQAGNVEVTQARLILLDTIPPSTAIMCNGGACSTGWYSRPVAVSLVAADSGAGVASTRYTTDGTSALAPGALTYTGPFTVSQVATVRFASTDLAGNGEVERQVQLSIDTLPPANVGIATPADGATVTGTARITASATDNVGIFRVRFYLDGVQLGTRTVSPWAWNWNTGATTKGQHTLKIRVEDAAANYADSALITVTVY